MYLIYILFNFKFRPYNTFWSLSGFVVPCFGFVNFIFGIVFGKYSRCLACLPACWPYLPGMFIGSKKYFGQNAVAILDMILACPRHCKHCKLKYYLPLETLETKINYCNFLQFFGIFAMLVQCMFTTCNTCN